MSDDDLFDSPDLGQGEAMNQTALAALSGATNATGGECPGHSPDDVRVMLAELERRGWKLVQIDPFAAADPPPGCCGGWVGPSGQRTMCCPVAALDSTNAPTIGSADVEPDDSCGICEGMCCGSDVLTDRQGVLDAFAERLTKIEDYLYIQDPHWQGRP